MYFVILCIIVQILTSKEVFLMKKRYETIFLELLLLEDDVARCSNLEEDSVKTDVYSVGDKVAEDKF